MGMIRQRMRENPTTVRIIVALAALGLFGGLLYWQSLQGRVYIENAQIQAPVITVSPSAAGFLDRLYVDEGEYVGRNQVLAKVGDELLKARTAGLVIRTQNTPGQMVTPQDAIVEMIDPGELKVVGAVEEDKGLSDISVGQRVVFTVDAFGSRQYEGYVESIATTALQPDIVFSISNTRQERSFNVKAGFDSDLHPELKNGMSARMWVYK
jgi:multidrug resistance efflux pump